MWGAATAQHSTAQHSTMRAREGERGIFYNIVLFDLI